MQTGIAHLKERNFRITQTLRQTNSRVKQHTREEVRVLVGLELWVSIRRMVVESMPNLYDQEVPLDIAGGQDYVCGA